MIDPEALRVALSRKGWSQARLAKETGCSEASITRILRGRLRSSRLLPKLAQALGVPFQELDRDYAPKAETEKCRIAPFSAPDIVVALLAFFRPDIRAERLQALAQTLLSLAETHPDSSLSATPEEQLRLRFQGALAQALAPMEQYAMRQPDSQVAGK